ncbi:MAG: HD domain-containing protein [Chlorobiota bacterium]|nr:HD domain-containing protein [Chlorobiota bacterium]
MRARQLVQGFKAEFAEPLRKADYLLADTRIPWVSLYDHLVLTGGIAAAFAEELLRRGKTPEELCGLSLEPSELRHLACLCGLLHDLGKAREGETEYRLHVQRGVEYATEWLTAKGVDGRLHEIIVGSVARHHLRDGPQTLFEKLVCLADSYASAGDRPELGRASSLEEFLRTIRETEALERELFGGQPPLCLLMGDTDAIKGYVYETQALPEIRGASQILVELEDEVRKLFRSELVEECLIYCGGGGFLAIVPASMAGNLKQEIERLYLERTQVATVTVASSEPLGYVQFSRGLAPHTDEEVRNLSGQRVAGDLLFSHFEALLTDRTKRKNFGELVSALTGRLQQAKRMRELAPFFETLPVYRRCDSCGKRAAQKWDVTKEEWLCEVCNQKRQKGRQERRDFVTAFQEWARQKQGFEGKFRHPEDLDTLAGAGGRIALLYADGNNMGELLQLMPSPASYRHFSQVLESATRDSLFAAIWTVFGEDRLKDASQPVPFEIIALGGDDVVVIVPAEYGWVLALQLLKEFENHPGIQRLEQELTERLGESILRRPISLTLSAGLAIADVKYPVSFLFALAEGLLKQAKKLARERRTSTLCHLWLRAPVISEKADAVLDALYKRNSQQQTAMLTARPYTREDAEKLTNLAQQLTELPTTQRRTLAEALERGVHVSLNYALYQAARRKGRQEVLLRAFEELGSLLDRTQTGFWFWRNVPQEGWKTTLLDALELVELGTEKRYQVGGDNGTPPVD